MGRDIMKYRIVSEGIGHYHHFKIQKRLFGFLWWTDVYEPTLNPGESAPVIFYKLSEARAWVQSHKITRKTIKP